MGLREMATNLKRREEYKFAVRDMSLTAQGRVRAAERRLQQGANELPVTPVHLGHRTLLLWQYRRIAIWFHWLDTDTVSLDLAVDLNDLPEWWVQPTGTWYETYARDLEQSWDSELVE